MSEFEPISGPPATPAESPPQEVTTVVMAPVGTDEAPTQGAGRARPKGLVRWGVALATLAVMIGVVSVAFALLAGGTTSSTVQGWMPKTTVAYLEVRADLPGDQRAKVGGLLAKFPGFADQSSLDAKIDEALNKILQGSGVSWTTDVKPWLGGEVGVAVTTAALNVGALAGDVAGGTGAPTLAKMPDDGAVVLVAVKDPAAAKAWISKELGGTQTTATYAGGEITLVTGPLKSSLAFAVRGNVLLLGPEKAVKAALDTGGSSPVPSSASFTAATKSAPSAYIAFGYADVKAFVDASVGAAGTTGIPKACLDQVTGMVPSWASGSLAAADDALVLAAAVEPTGSASSGAKATSSAIASHLPATTLAVVEVRELGSRLVDGVATLKKVLACDPTTAAAVGQVEQVLGAVGGVDGLVGWAGDAAVGAEATGGSVGGGLAAITKDEAAAGKTLQQLQALLAIAGSGAGISSTTESYGKGTLLVLTLPAQGGTELPKIAVTVQGGVFALGTVDFVKGVVDTTASTSLASADAYKHAIAAAGGDGVRDAFVNLAGVRDAVESMIPAAQKSRYETDIKPFLVPLEAFASVGQAPGSTVVSRAVITFAK